MQRSACNAPDRARQAPAARRSRQDLLVEAVLRHGIPAVEALLALIETEIGADLHIDARLQALIDADTGAVHTAARIGRRRPPQKPPAS